jgi:hypothetical protein
MQKGFWCGNLRERDHLEDLGVDGMIKLKEILRKYKDRALIGPGYEPLMSCCEQGNKPCGSIKCRVGLDKEACEGLLHAVRLLVTSAQNEALFGYSQCLDASQGVEGSIRQRLDVVVIKRPETDEQTGVTEITDRMCTSRCHIILVA